MKARTIVFVRHHFKVASASSLLLGVVVLASSDSLAQLPPPLHTTPSPQPTVHPTPIQQPPPLPVPAPTLDIAPALDWGFERGAIAGFSGGNVTCSEPTPERLPHGDELARSIGGNYWSGTLDDGREGRCVFEVRGGTDAASADFTVGRLSPLLTLSVASDGPGAKLEIQTGLMVPDLHVGPPGIPGHPAPSGGGMKLVWTTQRTIDVPPAQAHGTFALRSIDLVALKGQRMRIHAVAPTAAAQNLRMDFIRVTGGTIAEQAPPVWGFADLHTHLFNHIGFGGKMFSGLPHSSIGYNGATSREASDPARAMPACHSEHGTSPDGAGVLSVFMEAGHNAGGYPTFKGWPRFFTLSHQQMYVDWVKRAWQGGLRVIHVDVGNGPILAGLYAGVHAPLGFGAARNPLGDAWNTETQLKAAHDFALLPDVSPWLEIARSSADARRIVSEGKLAVVLGIEVDDIGELTAVLRNLPKEAARTKIRDFVAYLVAHDVRHVIPIHLLENGFGSPAVYEMLFSIENVITNGHPFPTRDAYASGIRLGVAYDDVFGRLMEVAANKAGGRPVMTRQRGIAHASGLTVNGEIFMQEMMRAGIIIDVDHMSDRSVDRTLDLATSGRLRYPVISSHTGFRDLSFGQWTTADSGRTWSPNSTLTVQEPHWQDKFLVAGTEHLAKERDRSAAHLARIVALGGMVGVGAGPGMIPRTWQAGGSAVNTLCDGSSASFAQEYLYAVDKMGGRGIAIGTDMNGWNGMANPRFGPYACGAGMGDDVRKNFVGAQVDAQSQPVTYDALPGGRHYLGTYSERFTASSGSTSYDDDERKGWQALVLATEGLATSPPGANFGPDTHDQDMANLAYGLWLGMVDGTGQPRGPRPQKGWPDTKMHQRAGWDTMRNVRSNEDSDLATFEGKMARVFQHWKRMNSRTSNPPMKKQVTGQADFDINLDGFAQYGMLPDFIQDVKNQGVRQQELKPFFRSAEDYVRMWENIDQQRATARAMPNL